MPDRHAYIVAAKRSPIGRFLGGLSKLSAVEIGAQVARATLSESRVDPAAIDDVLLGMVLQAGAGQNPARQVALAAGLPDSISASTVNKVCGSGLQTVMTADQMVRCGDVDVVLAGGIESMSQSPFLLREMRSGKKFGSTQFIDSLEFDGLVNIYDGDIMGLLADETAAEKSVSRVDQDAFAARSHQRAATAAKQGAFAAELVPIVTRPGKEAVSADEGVRPETTPDALATLRPAFRPTGTITAGNASQLSDGASMVLVASDAGLKRLNATPLARIVAHTTSGMRPRDVFLTPIPACRAVCERSKWDRGSIDLWEINEAFAAEILAVQRALEIPDDRLNVNGGAIAMGHPLGASGARCLTTLLHAMHQRSAKRGLVSMCLGGGNAVAMTLERV